MFADCSSEAEVQHWMRYNIFLLLDVGTFSALVELLNMEIEYVLIVVINYIPFFHSEYYLFSWSAYPVGEQQYKMDRWMISSLSVVFSSQ